MIEIPLPAPAVTASILGLLGIGFGLWLQVAPLQASLTWHSTSGVITMSEVKRGRPGRSSIRLRYSYMVNGTSYERQRIHCSEFAQDSRFAGRNGICSGMGIWSPGNIVKQYPVGLNVPVYYDPTNPRMAALEIGPCQIGSVFCGAGCVWFVLVLLAARFMRGSDPLEDLPSLPPYSI